MPDTDHSTERKIEISVRDTGIGIPEDQQDKIFIRFYRIEDKRFPYQEGTGIGLTLVNEYMKKMNGAIRLNSFPGEGSEFVITLPVTQTAPIEKEIRLKGSFTRIEKQLVPQFKTNGIEWGLPRLLIIEDNKELTEYLKGLLGNEFQVLTAENGVSGVEQANEYIPDIVASDVMMRGKDGYQVCRELKSDFRTNHIPVVLLTARADAESRITGLECGADSYLTKPFDKKELMACLHNLFIQREKLKLKYQSKLYEKIHEGHDCGPNIRFLNSILTVLEKNYRNENFRIEDLYQHLGISRVQLHRKLIALTGQSTSHFIRSFRLQKARKLLLETDKNVSEIAYDVGFIDPNYFTRVFVVEYGNTPTDFRNISS
jgi:DNA-binding response OmpR family regulator